MASQNVRTGVATLALIGQAIVLFAPKAPKVDIASELPVDKLIHAAVFTAATWSLLWAGAPRVPVLASMVAYAPASEIVQHVLFRDRSGEVADVLADLVGVGLGAGAFAWGHRAAADRATPASQGAD